MVFVPFMNRVQTNQLRSRVSPAKDFESLFPTEELEKFVSFAVQQEVSLFVKFSRVITGP